MSGPADGADDRVDDELWSAIGDPTRRQMLDLLLAAGSGTATSLSDRLPVTRQAVAKHLAVLDRAGLVHGETAGRERQYRLDEAQLERALAQLHAVGSAWDGRLRRIKRLAESLQQAADDKKKDDEKDEKESE
jgi:ArsR family transcriptional regulator, cadmium/lead-responsive transcriptional repressor